MDKPRFRSQQKPGEGAEKPINSPCVSVCVLNQESVCTGCYRSGEEISYWGRYNNDQRREVLARARERARKMNPFLD